MIHCHGQEASRYKAEPLPFGYFPTPLTSFQVLPVSAFCTIYLTATNMLFFKSVLAPSLAVVALAAPVTQPRQAGGMSYLSSCPLA